MENLKNFKRAIFSKKNYENELELCYADFLQNFSFENATCFYTLLEMCDTSSRVKEIQKVIDLVRFPVKKSFY